MHYKKEALLKASAYILLQIWQSNFLIKSFGSFGIFFKINVIINQYNVNMIDTYSLKCVDTLVSFFYSDQSLATYLLLLISCKTYELFFLLGPHMFLLMFELWNKSFNIPTPRLQGYTNKILLHRNAISYIPTCKKVYKYKMKW